MLVWRALHRLSYALVPAHSSYNRILSRRSPWGCLEGVMLVPQTEERTWNKLTKREERLFIQWTWYVQSPCGREDLYWMFYTVVEDWIPSLGLLPPLAHPWPMPTCLFDCRWSHADSRQGEGQRISSLDEAGNVFIETFLSYLSGMVGYFQSNLHAWGDVTFFRADGEVRLQSLHIPLKPFPRQKKTREIVW